MIQRIQTVYLLIVTGLLITAMCLPMGYFTDTMGEHPFKALGMDVNGAFQSTWGLFGILMLSTIVAFATIFLYKNRMLQIRMSIFNSLLLVLYCRSRIRQNNNDLLPKNCRLFSFLVPRHHRQ